MALMAGLEKQLDQRVTPVRQAEYVFGNFGRQRANRAKEGAEKKAPRLWFLGRN